MRRLTDCYAGEDGLHCTLSGIFPNSVEDTPGTHRHFNTLSPAERVKIARAALVSAGMKGLPPLEQVRCDRHGRAIALDADSVTPVLRSTNDGLFGHVVGPSGITEEPANSKLTAEDRAFVRGLLKRMRPRKRRPERDRDNQVASDSEALAAAAAQTVRNGAAGFRAGDLADLQGAPRPIPVDGEDLEGKMRERKANRAVFERPLACDGRPMSDLEFYQRRALECSGGRS